MARRSVFRSRMFQKHGRKTFWIGGTIIRNTIAAGGSSTLFGSLNAPALTLRPFTIVRTRGYWHFRSDQQSATEQQDVAMGNIIVSDEAVAIGVTAVPTPVTQNQSSWFLFDAGSDQFTFTTGVGFISPTGVLRNLDSKSMRKVEEGQDLIQVVETGAGSDGVAITTFFRTLIKLH